MSLAALIIADEDGSVALLPVMGVPLIEYQARLAHGVGANHIIVSTAQVPAGLVAVLDRLRARGINVALARTAPEAAALVHPDETILLFEAGCVPRPSLLRELVDGNGGVIVTQPLDTGSRHQELIDAEHGWAGIARIDGALVRKTAEMLGEWALAPTLLRFAVQGGVARKMVARDATSPVRSVRSAAQAGAVTAALFEGETGARGTILGSAIDAMSRLLAQQAARLSCPPLVLDGAAWVLLALVFGLSLSGWTSVSLMAFALVPVAGGAARRLNDVALTGSRNLGFFWRLMPWVGRIAIVAAGYQFCGTGGDWGSLAVAAWLVWELWQAGDAEERWAPDEASATLIMGLSLLAGFPLAGLGLALAHSLAMQLKGLKFRHSDTQA